MLTSTPSGLSTETGGALRVGVSGMKSTNTGGKPLALGSGGGNLGPPIFSTLAV